MKVEERTLGPNRLPKFLTDALPSRIIFCHDTYLGKRGYRAEEIRIRSGRQAEICFRGTSILCDGAVSAEEINEIFYKLCGGSVYAHEETVCNGFIRGNEGIRIGISGRATVRGGRVEAVGEILSLNIRLPCLNLPKVTEIAKKLIGSGGGMLVISPPGVGKTTVLRALIKELAEEQGKRVAVVDSSGELSAGLYGEKMRLDILDSYPRGKGVEIAIRTLSPQIIVCDEIGSEEEAIAIEFAANCGAQILASAHGESAEKIIRRPIIERLHKKGVFENYLNLYRLQGEPSFRYLIVSGEDISIDPN